MFCYKSDKKKLKPGKKQIHAKEVNGENYQEKKEYNIKYNRINIKKRKTEQAIKAKKDDNGKQKKKAIYLMDQSPSYIL